jgi:bacterial/archaeal transporter family-2 protein
MTRPVAVICTLLVGGLIALQPAANAAMSKHVGDLGAAFISSSISLAIIGTLLLVFGHPGRLSAISAIRPEQTIGGIGGAAVVTVSLIAVRPLGAGALVALLVTAQLVVALLADRFGWFGLHHVGIGGTRVLGLVLAVAGTILVTRS